MYKRQPYFRTGYELHLKLPEEHWQLLELFIEYRTSIMAVSLSRIRSSGIVSDLEKARQFVIFPLMQENVLDGFDIDVYKRQVIFIWMNCSSF